MFYFLHLNINFDFSKVVSSFVLCSREKLSKKVFKIQNREIHDNLSLIKNEKMYYAYKQGNNSGIIFL